jgi:hypothetical protein
MRNFQTFSEKYIDIAYLDINAKEKSILYAMLFLEESRGVGSYTYEDLHQYTGIAKQPELPRSEMQLSLESLLAADLIERVPHSADWRPHLGVLKLRKKLFTQFRIRWEAIDDRKNEPVEVVREVSFRRVPQNLAVNYTQEA